MPPIGPPTSRPRPLVRNESPIAAPSRRGSTTWASSSAAGTPNRPSKRPRAKFSDERDLEREGVQRSRDDEQADHHGHATERERERRAAPEPVGQHPRRQGGDRDRHDQHRLEDADRARQAGLGQDRPLEGRAVDPQAERGQQRGEEVAPVAGRRERLQVEAAGHANSWGRRDCASWDRVGSLGPVSTPEDDAGAPDPASAVEMERRAFVRRMSTETVGIAGRVFGLSKALNRGVMAGGQAMQRQPRSGRARAGGGRERRSRQRPSRRPAEPARACADPVATPVVDAGATAVATSAAATPAPKPAPPPSGSPTPNARSSRPPPRPWSR